MDERSSRIFVGLGLLAVVWIGVYWMWEPSQQTPPQVSFANNETQADDSIVVSLPSESSGNDSVNDEKSVGSDSGQNEEQLSGSTTPSTIRVIPPEFQIHVVRDRETMETIARQYYGSKNDWVVISRANPRVDPNRIKAGTELRIPVDKNNIQGIVVSDDPQELPPGVIDHPLKDPADQVIEYVVQPNDSLTKIAKQFYGSIRYADYIYETNRDQLRSKDALRIGQVLKLGPKPDAP